jgi:peptide deformylase
MIIKEVKKLREKVTESWSFEKPPKDTTEFANELIEAMWKNSGLGVSANQLGYNYRVFAMRGETKKESIVCFNPQIKDFSPEMNTMEEGCLSLPDVFAKVVRPEHVAIAYFNSDGEEEGQLASGLTARVFQHELDHLDGILFIDRIGELTKQRAFDKARKIQKFRARGKPQYQYSTKFAL